MAKNANNYWTYGLIMMLFGLITLLNRTGILKLIPYSSYLTTTGSFFMIAGIILLLTKSEKTNGIMLTIIGVLLNADMFFGWTRNYSMLIMPIALLLIGIILIVRSK